ncbi:MAG: NTE family protein, partial [Litorivivens sp.]
MRSQIKTYFQTYLRLSLIFFGTILMNFSSAAQSIRNLTLGPCDLHSIAYCGALEILTDEGVLAFLDNVSGEEGGAIVATLLAIGYSPEEISDIMVYTDFSPFINPTVSHCNPINGAVLSFENDAWKGWLESYIAKKLGSSDTTFGELHQQRVGNEFYDLFILARSANETPTCYSHETHADMKITEAVFKSCSLMSCAGHLYRQSVEVDGLLKIEAVFDDPKYYSGLTIVAFDKDFVNPQSICVRV